MTAHDHSNPVAAHPDLATVPFDEVVRPPYSKGAITRSDFPGFKQDYLALHSLIRRYEPSRFLEIGTSSGSGTNVICRAVGIRRFRTTPGKEVFSIDVPPGTDPTILYPEGEDGHPEKPGKNCRYPFTQLYGNSMEFDFRPYHPLDGWFIDGKHDYTYAKGDTEQALRSDPKLIIWHDVQIEGVAEAVVDVMRAHPEYEVRAVAGTRIGYAVRSAA